MFKVLKKKVFIKNLVVNTKIGLYDAERLNPQPIKISVQMEANEVASVENINDTIDYAQVIDLIKHNIDTNPKTKTSYHLLETLANDLIQLINDNFSVKFIKLHISKTTIFADTEEVGVEYYFSN